MQPLHILINYEDLADHIDVLREAAPRAHFYFASPDDEDLSFIDEVEVLCGRPSDYILANAPNLRWVQSISAGINYLPLDRLQDKGIILTNVRGMHGDTIADHVMMFILALSRELPAYLKRQWNRDWDRTGDTTAVAGSTMGIVGLGGIGIEVAKRCRAFDMEVIGTNRSGTPTPYADEVFGASDLEIMLPRCDYLAVCCPLTPETRALIGRKEMDLLPAGACVVNIGRGPIIDEDALVESLERGHLGGAGLDVFEEEPLPADSPLWAMEHVIITPHVSGKMRDYAARTAERFAENIGLYRAGRPLKWAVDYQKGY